MRNKKQNIKTGKATLLLIVVFLISHISYLTSHAQVPGFVNTNASKLYFSKDSSQFMNFYKKIDELREGKRKQVTVIHFGGSHIQAGFWTEVLMDGFQGLGNFNGGGTFIFPFKIVKTNSPHFFKSFTTGKWERKRSALAKEMCDNLGMSGMAGITNDSANTFGFNLLKNNHHQNFNSLRVYHNFNPSFEFSIANQTDLHFVRKDFMKEGYSEFVFETFIDSVNFNLVRKDTLVKNFMLKGFSIESSNPGFYYAAIGVNGASTSSYLRCQSFVDELATIPPDLVIFSLGVNDTHDRDFSKQEFKQNYDSLVKLVKSVSPECAVLYTTTTDNWMNRKTPNKRPIKAQEAFFEMMQEQNAAVYDLYAVMGGYRSIYKWYKAGLAAKDRVHFNGRGYRILAGLMFEAIDKSYKLNSKIK